MLRLAFDFIITWRETRTRPNAYNNRILRFMVIRICKVCNVVLLRKYTVRCLFASELR